jgi:putative endopeptidase
MKKRSEVLPLLAKFHHEGISGFFGAGIGADFKNSSMNIVMIGQGGITLGERDYYLKTDSATMAIRTAYKRLIIDLFQLCGNTHAQALAKMQDVMEIETAIAQKSLGSTELRIPENSYHKLSYAQLLAQFPGIDWNTYFSLLGMKDFKEVNMAHPAPIHEAEMLLKKEPLDKIKAYLEWNVINLGAMNMSDQLRARAFDFYGRTLSGQQEDKERWKRAVAAVEGFMGEAVGQVYVQKYFPASYKERMVKLVKNLQTSLAERIKAQDWMSDSTKAVALDKLAAFYVKIGYPNKWRDYSGLQIKNDNYVANILRSNTFDFDYEVQRKLNKPVDKDEWQMTPQTINAYYDPTTNEICFPAGILQPPFFNMDADDAYNYGAIGVVIGHEMTHGFDDEGRQFDKNGNLRGWWQTADTARFNARAAQLSKYFSTISVLPGLKCNGQLTLGENLADHGGVMVAYNAFKNATKDHPLPVVDGFTPEQRFFLAYASVWAENNSDAYVRMVTTTDPHSIGRWRVNGTLPQIDSWYDAFGITANDPLFIPKDKRVAIW